MKVLILLITCRSTVENWAEFDTFFRVTMVVLSRFAVERCRPFDQCPVFIDARRHAQRHDAIAYRIRKWLAELIGVEPIKVRVGEEALAVGDTGIAKAGVLYRDRGTASKGR